MRTRLLRPRARRATRVARRLCHALARPDRDVPRSLRPPRCLPLGPPRPRPRSLASAEPAVTPTDYKVTFGFAVPSGVVEVSHPFTPPPLRTLVGISSATTPRARPRTSGCRSTSGAGIRPTGSRTCAVLSDGSGTPIPVTGNAFLRVVFLDAQAHNDRPVAPSVPPPRRRDRLTRT